MKTLEKVLLSGAVLFSAFAGGCSDEIVPKGETPTANITSTYVPDMGKLSGKVDTNVKPGRAYVATFIRVHGTWWPKPYWNRQLIPINEGGTFETEFRTGGDDSSADAVYLAVVTREYTLLADGASIKNKDALPQTTDKGVLAVKMIEREGNSRSWKQKD